MRRYRLKNDTGYAHARKMIIHLREKERSTFTDLGRIFDCTILEAITLYVQERTKLENVYAKKETLKVDDIKPPHKYAHFFEEPMNGGCTYAEYRRRSVLKSRPAKRERLKVLKEERKKRIALYGKIVISQNTQVASTLRTMRSNGGIYDVQLESERSTASQT